MQYSFKIFKNAAEMPEDWDKIIGKHNILFSTSFCKVLDKAVPENITCRFVGFYFENLLIGGAVIQFMELNRHQNFHMKGTLPVFINWFTSKFIKNVIIVGNNLLTGQNGFYFNTEKISPEKILDLLQETVETLQKQERKTDLIIYKDYNSKFINLFKGKKFNSFYRFSVQPNMILNIRSHWKTPEDYLADFSKKYRIRSKTARKKSSELMRKQLSYDELLQYQTDMQKLYLNVAENAPFNTFFLPENHFFEMKNRLKENFVVMAYFHRNEMVGFCTMIINNKDLDTYFLGYSKTVQKEKQLYLNMLLDMSELAVKLQLERVIFGRTALEIKSTVGAEPVKIYGLIKHRFFLVNKVIKIIFPYFSKQTEWVFRDPFRSKSI